MSRLLLRGERAPAGYRFPALVWSLLHVPIVLGLYASGIVAAMRDAPAAYRAALWPTFLPQAAVLAVATFVVALPFSLRPRAYRFAAPAVAGVATAVIALDSRVYDAVHFHLNGFFVRVLLQPNALRVTGVPVSHVVLFLGAAAVFVALDVAAGAWFIRRFASPRRAWAIAATIFLVGVAERFYGSTLTYLGGPSIFAATSVLPAQVPIRMTKFLSRFFGPRTADQFAGQESMRLPSGVAPADVRFARTPDVLLVLAESLPADHLDAKTMPNLWRRTEEGGARFTRHYASSVATNFTVFSTMYGLQPQKMERVVGTGRRPLLFPAFQANGYEVRVLTASCLDWMNLKDHGRGETNFASFAGVPESSAKVHCDAGTWSVRDERLLADARTFVTEADPAKPLFTFMFLFGTHFDYFYPPSSEVHVPAWDGVGGLKTTSAAPFLVKNRARNAAHAMDAKLEDFLGWYERTRGRRPLVIFTGDHGEEFREKGHIGHGSAVTREQIHVPFVVFGEGVPRGTRDVTTSHVDIVPTLFSLLGDTHPPSTHSDGVSVFEAPEDRFVFSTVGWEPRYAATGRGIKVTVYAGLAGAAVTDEDDRPLPDGAARLAENAGRILRALRGEEGDAASASPTPIPTSTASPAATSSRP